MSKKHIKDMDFKDKKVLVRVDFNVPLDNKCNVTNDKRIKAALPTINYLINHDAKVILMSHLGRPKGEKKRELSLKPVAEKLSQIMEKDVKFVSDCVGEKVISAVKKLRSGDVILLENTRFYPGEKKNDPEFAHKLAQSADIFINDAFGTAHRAHASNVGVAKILPAAIGFLIEKELKYLRDSLDNPQKPFTAIFGGAKVSGKIELLERILDKANNLLIGGAMMFTFVRAMGYETGKSLVEKDKIELANNLFDLAKEKKVQLVIPQDTVIAKEAKEDSETKIVSVKKIPPDWMGLDIGEKTIQKYKDVISGSGTIVWNGPMGMFELDKFATGTNEIAQALAESKATTIIGGGDSAAAIEKIGLQDKFTHISTGGGASLEMLAGNDLPGISVIPEA